MICRNCSAEVQLCFCDLGCQPLANSYLGADELPQPEVSYPLRPLVCEKCLLVQLPELARPDELFREYAYFSGQSSEWVDHCWRSAQAVVGAFKPARVLELASNDGTLLEAYRAQGCQVVGVEPARNVARAAQLAGIATIDEFFGVDLARALVADGYTADVVVANNVLAHVPDLDDFVGGIAHVLADDGVAVFEFPYVVNLIEANQFDTIYHEHFSYFSLWSAKDALGRRGLDVFDVEEIPTHGGSLRVYARHHGSTAHDPGPRLPQLMRKESGASPTDQREVVGPNYLKVDAYAAYAGEPALEKRAALCELIAHKGEGRRIAGYGAPAKGNTFLNYVGVGCDTVEFVVDSTPAKQGTFLPGSRIPVLAPDALVEAKPDVVLILPWNWEREIRAKIERDCPWRPLVIARPFS